MRKRIAAVIAALTSGLALAACQTGPTSNPASRTSFTPDSRGNLSIWGRDVTVDQTLTGALRVSNGNVVVNGAVDGDVEVWNGSLTVNGEVGRDVRLSQGAFKLTERGLVHGTVYVYDNGQGVEAEVRSVAISRSATRTWCSDHHAPSDRTSRCGADLSIVAAVPRWAVPSRSGAEDGIQNPP